MLLDDVGYSRRCDEPAKELEGHRQPRPGIQRRARLRTTALARAGAEDLHIHVYALSAPPPLDRPQREVTREVLLTAIKDLILDSAELKVTYTRQAAATDESPAGGERDKRQSNSGQ